MLGTKNENGILKYFAFKYEVKGAWRASQGLQKICLSEIKIGFT